MNRYAMRTNMGVLTSGIAVCFVLFLSGILGCSRKEYPDDLTIKFILPEGYEGYFAIIRDKDGKTYSLPGGGNTISIEIDSDGLIEAKSTRFFAVPHVLEAEFDNGQKLLVHPFDDPKDNEIAVRSCTSRLIDGRHEDVYYYGTVEGVNWFRENGVSTKIEDLLKDTPSTESVDED